MLLIDIDDTISPTRPSEAPPTSGVNARAFAFRVFMPDHILEFLRERNDIVMLSTWGVASFDMPEAFGFKAKVALMEDFTDKLGIEGKFEVVKALQPIGWADDHIRPKMRAYAKENGIITVIPRKGYISESLLDNFAKAIEQAPAREPREIDSILHTERPKGRM